MLKQRPTNLGSGKTADYKSDLMWPDKPGNEVELGPVIGDRLDYKGTRDCENQRHIPDKY